MNGAAAILVAAALCGGAAAGYLLAPGAPRTSLAVVDLSGLLRAHHAAAAGQLFQTPGQLPQVAARGAAYGQALDAAVQATSRECGCTLLMREAVVAGQLPDLTGAVAAHLKAAGATP